MKILYVVSELFPLIKTGGLGDVAHSLPSALQQQGAEVRILLPAYREVMQQMESFRILGWLELSGSAKPHGARVLEVEHPALTVPLWLVDCPVLFDRPGNPYVDADGYDWPDNAERFSCFSQAAAMISMGALQDGWRADVVHSHDWQTGLVSAYLEEVPQPPRRIFTIHNLAYGGHFSHEQFVALHLPPHWWHPEGVEFHGGFSMLKAGLIYADAITTVSPTYAEEICTSAYGYGMEGILNSRRFKLSGILNGIDNEVWDPAHDPHLAARYSIKQRGAAKKKNKAALFERLNFPNDEGRMAAPLIGMVGRLVEQKGIDLVLEAIPKLLERSDANFVLLGSGHRQFEYWLKELAEKYPRRVVCHIGYSEPLAHLVEAGADMFLMPSRYEPCGLNQMYSLRYGTPPIVNHTGGLADTVVDANATTLKDKTATGFVMSKPTSQELIKAVQRALELYAKPRQWQQLQRSAMQQCFSWDESAAKYLSLYKGNH